MVFRQEDDKGVGRLKATPPKETLLKNLENFCRKWKHISDTSTDGQLLRESFDEQVKNLKKHILQGCLSDIPPGYSTSINESLHQKINNLFAGAKMGPELALALLTVFFYAWNSRRKNTINGLPIVEPLSSAPIDNECGFPFKEGFGMGMPAEKNIPEPVGYDQSEPQSEQTRTVAKRAMSMLRLYNFLNILTNNGSGVNWYDLFFHNEILGYVFKKPGSSQGNQCETNYEAKKSHFDGIAARFGMELVPMPKDGNCLLRAVAFTISQRFSSVSPTLSTACQQYADLGIDRTCTIEHITQTLRRLMTNELKKNKTGYLPFLQNITETQYDNIVRTFEQPGVFAGDLGDLMVRALSNALKTPLIILTDIENYDVITVTPDEFNDANDNIFITYTSDGQGTTTL